MVQYGFSSSEWQVRAAELNVQRIDRVTGFVQW